MLGYFLRGLALGLPAAAQPGPFQAYLLGQTMKNGWRRTLPAALAPLLSDGPIVALVLLVLTQLPPSFLALLKLGGGLFLLYLAFSAWRTLRHPLAPTEDAPPASRQSVLEATVMNLLNPNPYLFWSTVGGPIFLEGWRLAPRVGLAYLVGFYGTLIGGTALLILLFGTARQLGPRVERGLLAASVVVLVLFALWQLWQALTALLIIAS